MLEHWIWLAHMPGITEHEKIGLLEHYGSPEAIYSAGEAAAQVLSVQSEQARAALSDRSLDRSQKIMDTCLRKGIGILTWSDEAYPNRLRQLFHPPILLYFQGTLPDFDHNAAIGIVGTRRASAYGLLCARRFGYEISSQGGIVVSGAADGIDGAAMQGALTGGSPVVGVLGCGVDVVYPKKNAGLYRDTALYGCLLSEFAPGEGGLAWHFPKRNRIISGLSCGVLVVEAPAKSGALYTARAAAEQGRDVFVVPGTVNTEVCAGSNALLREGAIAVSSGWELLEEYHAWFPDKLHKEPLEKITEQAEAPEPVRQVAQKPALPRKKPAQKPAQKEKGIDKKPSAPYSDFDKRMQELSEPERVIAATLFQGERLTADIIAETGLPAGKVLSTLTMLELKKVVVRRPGNRIALKTAKP